MPEEHVTRAMLCQSLHPGSPRFYKGQVIINKERNNGGNYNIKISIYWANNDWRRKHFPWSATAIESFPH